MRPILPLALAAALAACAKGPAHNAVPANAAPPPTANTALAAPPAAPAGKLAQIFTPDILGANVAYLETITGPAFSTEGSDRVYKLEGCKLIVGVKGAKIDNIGIQDYSARCSFPIAQYFGQAPGQTIPNYPTFGDIEALFGGSFGADCLTQCGNATDPVVSLSYHGSHADNFNDLYAAITINDEPALTAYQDWGDKLIAKHGQDYVVSGKFNTDDSMDDVAAKDFGPIHPDTIRIGQDLPGPESGGAAPLTSPRTRVPARSRPGSPPSLPRSRGRAAAASGRPAPRGRRRASPGRAPCRTGAGRCR
jgi:hypothetical protein